ncbi:hypothetical protein GQ600_8435 [Phytophthora cactorum]|nr:hypothetical protein GQ600_8435 [Phytophthora cactorum]
MKALAHRLRGRRASRRDDGLVDETERSFRFEEASRTTVGTKERQVTNRRPPTSVAVTRTGVRIEESTAKPAVAAHWRTGVRVRPSS